MPNWKKQKDDFGHDGRETDFGKFISSPRSPSRMSPMSKKLKRSESSRAYRDDSEPKADPDLTRPPQGKWSHPGDQERDYQQRDYLSSRPLDESRHSRSDRYRPSNYGINHEPMKMDTFQDSQSDTGTGYGGHSRQAGGSYGEEQIRRRPESPKNYSYDRSETSRFDYEYQTGPYCEYSPGRFVGKGPRGYKRSEERLKEDFCEALTRHPEIDASDVEVSVENTELVLKGTVPERKMKYLIDDLAEHSFGIPDFRNEIRIKRSENAAPFVESANLPSSKAAKKSKSSSGSKKSDPQ